MKNLILNEKNFNLNEREERSLKSILVVEIAKLERLLEFEKLNREEVMNEVGVLKQLLQKVIS